MPARSAHSPRIPGFPLFRESLSAAILSAALIFPIDSSELPCPSQNRQIRSSSIPSAWCSGLLVAFAIVLFAVARTMGADTQGADVLLDPLHLAEVQKNIAPFAQEAIAGKDNSALAALSAPAGAAPAVSVPTTGEQAFKQVCSACHATGINGAPKIGDHAAWGPRIAQGKDTLYKDAIAGKGNMPPKGGTNWPDATIRMTVDYMVSLNK